MKTIPGIIVILMIIVVAKNIRKDPFNPVTFETEIRHTGFDSIKHLISKYESTSTKRIHQNKNSLDLGVYQINSRHLTDPTSTGKSVRFVLNFYGVKKTYHDRVAALLTNDQLNEDCARAIWIHQGIRAWTGSNKRLKKALGL